MLEAIRHTERPRTDIHRAPPNRSSRSAALYHSLYERSGVGIAALDGRCRIRRANGALLSLLDRGPAEVQDVEFTDLLHPDNRSKLQFNFTQLCAGRTGRFTEPVKVKRLNGAVEGHLTAVRVRSASRAGDSLMVLLQADTTGAEAPAGARTKLLSETDAKILEGIAAGASTVQLASQLFLSSKGIEYHVSAMLRRLDVPNRPALVSRAYTMGILSSGTWPPRVQCDYVH